MKLRLKNQRQFDLGSQRTMPEPRNCLISNICFKAGYIYSWGRGIEKIINACTQYGCAPPIFESNPASIQVTLLPKFKMPPQVSQQEPPQVGASQQTHEVRGSNPSTHGRIPIDNETVLSEIINNKPAKPLNDAQLGGYFFA
ncbi:ATP-binding protein [Coraliomargarita algicola]|uniref:ATP-binding protein n=1 Tax=Coraliomargarita algicola TaxID=3092156 RepID=A0ABZ0RRZ5_9BACT|nr:ATP-binding protein [Coraliomargarita sp. J2-16]WPJ97868.1 ATP-binding protein [Coraliomargarita sp. J2-16]